MPKIDLFVDAYEEALDTLTAQARLHPEYADVQHRLGLLFSLAGEPDRAISHFEQALELNPRYVAACSALGYALERGGAPAAAERRWQEGVDWPQGADHPGTALDLAMAAGRRGHPEEGLAALDPLPANRTFRDLIARERMLLLFLAGRDSEASVALDLLWRRSPHFRTCFASQGLTRDGATESGRVAEFIREREANHNLADIHTYLSDTYAAFGSFAKSESELRVALHVGFDLPSFHVRLGRLRRLSGDERRAADEFRQALEFDDAHVSARIELGHELVALGRTDEAVEHYRTALASAPGYADIQHQLGVLYVELGRLTEGEASLRRALAINPDFALARASLALCCVRAGRDAEALVEYERAVQLGLRSGDLYLGMALIHMRQGDGEGALSALEQGVAVSPQYAPLHYHLGRLHRGLGHKDEARDAWRRFFAFADDLEFDGRWELFEEDLRVPVAV